MRIDQGDPFQVARRAHAHKQQWATGDGATTAFRLTTTPTRADDLLVYVDGALKRPAASGTANDYAWTPGSNLVTFSAAPAAGKHIAFLMVTV